MENQAQQMDSMNPEIQASSFMTRAMNVFASPGELFEEVRQAPVKSSSWIIPMIASALIAVLFVFAIFNNPTLRDQATKAQHEAMQKKVDAGKMTSDQMEAAEGMMNSPMIFIGIGGATATIGVVIFYFLIALALWVAAKIILKYQGPYGKVLEVQGLASIIGILGALITLVMMSYFNSMYATPSAALIVASSYDMHNVGHLALSAINVFTLWQIFVLGVGLGKLSGKSTGMSAGVVLAMYGLWEVGSICFSIMMR